MATVFLVLVVVLVIAGLVFGVISLLSGDDPGMSAVDPDGRARPLPNNRSLSEFDLKDVRFDTGLRGYRMSQVDRVLRRTAYDLGYKDEMIAVLEAEVIALRDGRTEDAELLRKARESAAGPLPAQADHMPPTGDHAPKHGLAEEPEDIEPVEEVQDFARTATSPAGTAEAVGVDAEPATTDVEPEDLPREGSLRRRSEPRDDLGDTADTSESHSAGASDSAGPSDGAAASDNTATDPVDRPAPHG